ncbi:MAG TPA: hypothetical protein VHA52_13370 [Candidatus Babeliaceae bacterium]|nr:hypothetical protein [Candidatus Babeliaceae bacterium]
MRLQAQVSVWKESKSKMQNHFREWKAYIEKEAATSDYHYALSIGARLNTNGWSGGLYFLNQESAGIQILWELHFSEIKQEKETKQENTKTAFTNLGKGKPYIFGKLNNVYILQFDYGRQQLLLPALLDGNLSVSLRYTAGPGLAFLKPYYLELVYLKPGTVSDGYTQSEKYSSDNARRFLEAGKIYGASKWRKGLGETKLIPGLFGELAFALEQDKPKAFIQTITFGGNAAIYTKPLAIMADQKDYRYQLSLFVGLAIGGEVEVKK